MMDEAGGMRTKVPAAFEIAFVGPEGPYTIQFYPLDEWDGMINVTIGGQKMRWDVLSADSEEDGRLVLSGPTSGSEPLWNDLFWFELRRDDSPATIRFYGDKVLWREDCAA